MFRHMHLYGYSKPKDTLLLKKAFFSQPSKNESCHLTVVSEAFADKEMEVEAELEPEEGPKKGKKGAKAPAKRAPKRAKKEKGGKVDEAFCDAIKLIPAGETRTFSQVGVVHAWVWEIHECVAKAYEEFLAWTHEGDMHTSACIGCAGG
jgi:hypothetical protein